MMNKRVRRTSLQKRKREERSLLWGADANGQVIIRFLAAQSVQGQAMRRLGKSLGSKRLRFSERLPPALTHGIQDLANLGSELFE
jgi:hypothetical protein